MCYLGALYCVRVCAVRLSPISHTPQIVAFSIISRLVSGPEDIDARVALHNEMEREGLPKVLKVRATQAVHT